jgi:hypothetical protein
VRATACSSVRPERAVRDREIVRSNRITPTISPRSSNGRAPVLHTGDGGSIPSRGTTHGRLRKDSWPFKRRRGFKSVRATNTMGHVGNWIVNLTTNQEIVGVRVPPCPPFWPPWLGRHSRLLTGMTGFESWRGRDPVAQWTRRRTPKPQIQVRYLAGSPIPCDYPNLAEGTASKAVQSRFEAEVAHRARGVIGCTAAF